MSRFRTGLVVGKFSPLHMGHRYLITEAWKQCEKLIILSYSNPEFTGCDASERRHWLESHYGSMARILVIDKPWMEKHFPWISEVPENDAPAIDHRKFCGMILVHGLHTTVDAVFTSEEYGDGFAEFLTGYFHRHAKATHEVKHVCVDIGRNTFPVSGTSVRQNVMGTRRYLDDLVLSSMIKRMVIYGGESTGKSTLADALAKHLKTSCVPEYGREFCDRVGGDIRLEDFLHIGEEQIRLERLYALDLTNGSHIPPVLICDTSPLTTMMYSVELTDQCDDRLVELSHRHYDYTVLCAPDIPWVQDGQRIGEEFRQRMHEKYVWTLGHRDIPYLLVHGSVEDRINQIVEHFKL